MEPEDSLLWAQEPISESYSGPKESSPQILALFKKYFNIILKSLKSLRWDFRVLQSNYIFITSFMHTTCFTNHIPVGLIIVIVLGK